MMNLLLPYVDDDDILMALVFQNYIKNNKDKLKYDEDINLYAIYGCPPGAIWNGGRALRHFHPKQTYKQISERINFLNDLGIQVHITFSNNLLKEEHLNDEYCNMILSILDNDKNNCVIVNSDLLKNYIRKTHPNLKITGSITQGNSLEILQERVSQDYDYLVCYKKRGIINFISTLHKKDIDKIEIMVTESCAQCECTLAHSTADSQSNLDQDFYNTFKCYYRSHPTPPYPDLHSPNFLVPLQQCFELGINKFKFSGRGEHVDNNLKNWILYLISPDYKDIVFDEVFDEYKKQEQLF